MGAEAEIAKLLGKPTGSRKNPCCIVIPAGNETAMLEKHLRLLSMQTTKEFDVLVVGRKARVPNGMNARFCEERRPVGSSGGFGLGQVQAYLLGYEYIISADLDCFPISKGLVERLVADAKKTGKVAMPLSLFDRGYDPRKSRQNHIINHYGTASRKVLESCGFMDFRFFKGGEDVEMQKRLEECGLVFRDASLLVEHKNKECNHLETMSLAGSKFLYYSKNFIIANLRLSAYCLRRGRAASAAKYFLSTLAALANYLVVYRNHRDLLAAAFFDGLSLNMGKVYCARETAIERMPQARGRGVQVRVEGERGGDGGICFKPKEWLLSQGKPSAMLHLASAMVAVAASRADYLEPTPKFLDDYKFFIKYLVLAKPIKYTDGRLYREKGGLVGVALSLVLALALLPLLIAVSAAMVALCLFDSSSPVTVSNLAKNLGRFSAYLEKMEAECAGRRKAGGPGAGA